MGGQEIGTCSICKTVGVIQRKYYYFDVECDCCSSKVNGKPVHFVFIAHCKNCAPTLPNQVIAKVDVTNKLIKDTDA